MTWLVQQQVPLESVDATAIEEPAAASGQPKVHWMTMLPAGVPQQTGQQASDTPADATGATPAALVRTDSAQQVEGAGAPAPALPKSEAPEKKKDKSADEDKDETAVVPVLQAAPVVIPEAVHMAGETDEKSRATGVAEAPAGPAAEVAARVQGSDKGEVVWSADLRVAPQVESREPKGETGGKLPEPAAAARNPQSQQHGNNTGQQQGQGTPNQEAPKEAKDERPAAVTQPRTQAEADSARRPAAPVKQEQPAAKAREAQATHTVAAPEVLVKTAAAHGEGAKTEVAAARNVDAAEPLRPAQVSTVQVNIPMPNAGDDASPLRLVVTQRGDQVNVRLRSWDAGTAPIESSQMQPLLNSLADKGYVSEARGVGRVEELAPPTAEAVHAKHMSMAETANAGNDGQPFQGADDRQQQNQERQQQQQAFFLRRQLRNVQSQDFHLESILGADSVPAAQGAQR